MISEQRNYKVINMVTIIINEVATDREQDVDSWIHDIHSAMLEKVSYPDNISENDHVRIMSLHASKGLYE